MEFPLSRRDSVYEERDRVVAALARAAQRLGITVYVSRTTIDGWEPEWENCIYIDLPTGQVSWHFHDREMPLFSDFDRVVLPPYDGHSTAKKYERLDRWRP